MTANGRSHEVRSSSSGIAGRVPVRALLFSIAALLIPLVLPRVAPDSWTTAQPLFWLAALIPPFLLSYYRGWVGAALAFAIAMAVLSLWNGVVAILGGTVADDPLFLYVGSAYIVVTLAAGWVTELLHQARRDALRTVSDLFLSVSDGGVVTWASESCTRVLGIPTESITGRPFESLVHTLDAPAARAMLAADTESGLSSRRELRFVARQGGLRTIEVFREDRLGPRGRTGIELRGRDITELKLVEQQTRRAAQMEMLGRITSGIAPDFNNIVTTIQGHAAVLAHELRGTPQWSGIQQIQVAGDRLSALIHQLLAYTRMQPLNPVTVDLQATLRGMLPAVRTTLGESINVSVSVDERTPHVHIDVDELRNTLLTLAGRARRVMPDGGSLAVQLAPAELTPDRSRSFPYPVQAGQYAMLAISDSGPRPDPEALETIFQPFAAESATGLELASVYGFVKQSGGYIWAEAGEERGTHFTIYLPVAAQDAVEIEAARHEPPATRIMVVEDDVAVRSLVRVLLLRRGYSVLEASDGQDAFEVISRLDQPIDLLITDIMMPRMRGDALVEMVRSHQPDVRVLLMSGYGADPEVAGDATKGQFLHKPFSPDELLRAVHSTLVQGSPRITLN